MNISFLNKEYPGFYHGIGYGTGFTSITAGANDMGGAYVSNSGQRTYTLTGTTCNTAGAGSSWTHAAAPKATTPPSTAGVVDTDLRAWLLSSECAIPCCENFEPMPEPLAMDDYRFGFNGMEKDDDISGKGNSYTAEFWQYDSRLGRRWNIDPVIKDWESPYSTFRSNPIWFIDPNGDDPSTHTDEDGKVLAVKDDGDNGVYKHEGKGESALKSINENYSSTNTGAGGTKMGETLTPLSFANFELYESSKGKTIVPGDGARIDFNSNWASDNVIHILLKDPSAAEYFGKAGFMGDWDVKTKSPDGPEAYYYGSKLFGKYASARDAGNFTAGAVAQKSNVPNVFIDYGFGLYNQSGNNIPLMAVMGAVDLFIGIKLPAAGVGILLYRAAYGEDKLSKAGIEAGKSFIKGK